MNVRAARPADRPAIRDVARRSLEASYSLRPQAIATAVRELYDEAALADRFEDPNRLLLVADRDGQVVGFSESVRAGEEATLLWLHVEPTYRGEGIANELLDGTVERLLEAGHDRIFGRVIEANEGGNAFYEHQGFEKVGEDTVEIGDRTHVENVWAIHGGTDLTRIEGPDGRTLYVDSADADTGSMGSFFTVYADEERTDRYGYYCSHCGSLATAMDAMGRIECDSCGNTRKPTRWDAAYL